MAKKKRTPPTKAGWGKRKPRRGPERRKLMERCGRKAFLDPDELAYPVMSKGTKKCGFDCAGLQAAYKRGRQQASEAAEGGFRKDAQKHNSVARKAHQKGKQLGCRWADRPFGAKK